MYGKTIGHLKEGCPWHVEDVIPSLPLILLVPNKQQVEDLGERHKCCCIDKKELENL